MERTYQRWTRPGEIGSPEAYVRTAMVNAAGGRWRRQRRGIELEVLRSAHALVEPVVNFVRRQAESSPLGLTVLVPQVELRRRRYQLLQNQRGRLLATTLRRPTDVVVANLPFRIGS